MPEQPAAPTAGLVAPVEAVTLAAVAKDVNEPALEEIAAERKKRSPYQVAARSETEARGYSEVGLASWYGSSFQGRQTANGETFDRAEITAAHLSLPLPSYVRVTNLDNNRSITVRLNDRGPYVGNRLIDVSERTAELLAFRRHGLTRVKVDYLGKAPLNADDKSMLLASYSGPTPARTTLASAEPTRAVAFADTSEAGDGGGAMERLTKPYSVVDRILMAFDVASTAED